MLSLRFCTNLRPLCSVICGGLCQHRSVGCCGAVSFNLPYVPCLQLRGGCLQAVSTTIASDGMEACRRACGGHGYSLLSGLPTNFTHYVQNVTWEGDNNVMLLQVRESALRGCSH